MKLVELAVGDKPGLSFSPYVWRTKMALAHKGFEPEQVTISFIDKAALEASGSKTVPALEDNGKWVSDSWNIACYLEDTYPDRPALFKSATERALCHFLNAWVDRTLVLGLFPILILDIYNLLDEENQIYFRSTREARIGCRMEDYAADQESHLTNLQRVVSPMRFTLSNQSFLSGAAPGYADFAAFGPFQWARCAREADILEADDSLYQWRERMLDLYEGLGRNASCVGQ